MKWKIVVGIVLMLMLIGVFSGCIDNGSRDITIIGKIVNQSYDAHDDKTILIFEGNKIIALVGDHTYFELYRQIKLVAIDDNLNIGYNPYKLVEFEYID